jgi:hypothetical protein
VQTGRGSVKVRNLQRNSAVAVAVFDGEEAVIARGSDSLGIPLFDPRVRCVVEVTPRRLIFW